MNAPTKDCSHGFFSGSRDGCPYCKAEAFQEKAQISDDFFKKYGQAHVAFVGNRGTSLPIITVEGLYQHFAVRFTKEYSAVLEPELKRLHDLAITAYNSGGR